MIVDEDLLSLKKHIDTQLSNLSSFEKSTLCKILGDIYYQLYQAENTARATDLIWNKHLK